MNLITLIQLALAVLIITATISAAVVIIYAVATTIIQKHRDSKRKN